MDAEIKPAELGTTQRSYRKRPMVTLGGSQALAKVFLDSRKPAVHFRHFPSKPSCQTFLHCPHTVRTFEHCTLRAGCYQYSCPICNPGGTKNCCYGFSSPR
jgi:hypothetical protein